MADLSNSTHASTSHGPVTAAIRAVALEHDPSHAKVIPFTVAPSRRPPVFVPLDFNFPLSDSLWATCYLRPVRFAVDLTNMRGAEAVDYVTRALTLDRKVVRGTLGQLSLAIDHFEELAELCRVARGRLVEADAVAARQIAGRAGR